MTVEFFGSWFAYLVITFAKGSIGHLMLFNKLYARLAIFSRLNDPIVLLAFLALVIQGAVVAYLALDCS